MVLAVKVLLGLIILGCIIWPFVFKKEAVAVVTPEEKVLDALLLQKEQTYVAIKELDFDYNMDKLSKEDYKDLSQTYKQEAVAILQKIDALSADKKAEGTAGG